MERSVILISTCLYNYTDQQENIQPQLIVPPPSTNQATGFPSLQRGT